MKARGEESLRHRLKRAVEPLILRGITDKIFPGCSLAVWKREHEPLVFSWGRETYSIKSPEISSDTVFDLASLTKPLSTTLLVTRVVNDGRLTLDTTLREFAFLSPCPKEKQAIRIRDLLNHRSGLPAWAPLYEKTMGKEGFKRAILSIGLVDQPGKRELYSDLGFIILGFIVEDILQMDLDRAFNEFVARPFKVCVDGLGFKVQSDFIAPSLQCDRRKRLVRGDVHDLNAWALGGSAGHAGLFGSAKELIRFLSKLYLLYRDELAIEGFSGDILRKFLETNISTSNSSSSGTKPSFCLGFDTPSESGSQAGTYFSKKTVGHLGYTGTSFWIDLERGVIVVFLTNRTFPLDSLESRNGVKKLRPKLHDAVMKVMGIS